MTRRLTDQEIAAHVDGELDAAADADVRARLADDPAARALAGRLRELNARLAAAHPLPDAGEMPPAIAAALAAPAPVGAAATAGDGADAAPGSVVAFRQAARQPAWLPMAAAASVALLLGVASGTFLAGPADRADQAAESAAGGLASAGTALAAALETLPSGTLSADAVRPVVTFRDATGRPCREFETGPGVAPRVGIACREPRGGWEVLAIAAMADAAVPADGAFRPASGAGADMAIEATLDAIGAGDPLAPEEEARLLASGWR